MSIKNKGTGAGGAKTNANGIKFEEKVYLKEWLENEGFDLKLSKKSTKRSEMYEVHKSGNLIGYYGRQSLLYKALQLVDNSIDKKYVNSILSKRIFPDGFLIQIKPRRLIIFEKKWQQKSGSVDEKIQTAPFKLAMFERLLSSKEFSCEYQYILSDWFKDGKYDNVKQYYKTQDGIGLWIEGENLQNLKLESFIK